MAKLKEGTPEYEKAKKEADKKVKSHIRLTETLIKHQKETEPEKTSFVLGIGLASGYEKANTANYFKAEGYVVYLDQAFLGNLVFDWSGKTEEEILNELKKQ